MQALLRTIASILRSWLNIVRGRSATARGGQASYGSGRRPARDVGTEADTDQNPSIVRTELRQPPRVKNIALSESAESREELSMDDAPDSGASIELNQVASGRCVEHPQLLKESSESQETTPAPGATGESFAQESASTGRQEINPEPPCAMPEKSRVGGNGNEAVTPDEPGTARAQDSAVVMQAGLQEPVMPAHDETDVDGRIDTNTPSEQNEVGPGLAVNTPEDSKAPDTNAEDAKPCPRCGVTCLPDEVEQVFGYRTMRWKTEGGESSAVRRQSYCRRCRAEHTAELRARVQPNDWPDEQRLGDAATDPAGELAQVDECAKPAAANDPCGAHNHGDPDTTPEHVAGGPGPTQSDEVAPTSQPDDLRCAKRDRVPEMESGAVSEHDDATEDTADTVAESDGDEEERDSSAGRATTSDLQAVSGAKEHRLRPSVYRPPAGGSPPPPHSSPARNSADNEDASPTLSQAARVHVRILFQRGGYCTVSMLAKRLPEEPERLTVSGESGEVELLELQEEWYEVDVAAGLSDLLRTGFVWTDRETSKEWLLSGREIFVLAPGTEHRGFVSCPQLAVGRDHLVLCTATQLLAVEEALREAGCSSWTQLGEEDGVPAGWKVLRAVNPRLPVPRSNDNDILNVLRPLPDIEIALEGGIRLKHNQWLLGHPPDIHVYGDQHTGGVMIDGQEAVRSDQTGYTTPGWDTEGEHQIWCSNTNKSYSLIRGKSSWDFWPAHSLSLLGLRDENQKLALCGPLLRSGSADAHPGQRGTTQVPPSNPVLLGAQPGEVYFAYRRLDVRGAQCLGSPPFDPVWALPAQPLQGDKRRDRILLVGEPLAACNDAGERQRAEGSYELERWYQLILNASRKRLVVEPGSPATIELWRSYKQLARHLWKKSG